MNIKLFFFTAGLLMGVCFSLMWFAVFGVGDNYSAKYTAPKELRKKVVSVEVTLEKTTDSLHELNKALAVRLQDAKTQLAVAKKKATELQLQVSELLDTRFPVQPNRYPLPLSVCDSLAFTTTALMKANDTKDSLHEAVAVNQDVQLRNKDSTIALQARFQESLKSSFLQSVQAREELLRQNKLLQKSARNQRIKSKVLTAGLLLLSGAAASYILTH